MTELKKLVTKKMSNAFTLTRHRAECLELLHRRLSGATKISERPKGQKHG